jgi:hypothetical protein
MKTKLQYQFTALTNRRPLFQVSVTYPDGTVKVLGTVRHFHIRHMERDGWEASGKDGHRAVHEHRWQAALALCWDGQGAPPFPFQSSRRAEVETV